MDPLSLLSYLEGQERQQKNDQEKLLETQKEQDYRISSGVLSRLNSLSSDPTRYEAFKKTFIEGDPNVFSALQRTYGAGLKGMLDSSSLVDVKGQQEQDQRTKIISSGIISKLEEFKDDPKRYQAFKDTAFGVPEIKAALEKTYTPEALNIIFSTSGMETSEERATKKANEIVQTRRAQAIADVDPFVLTKAQEARVAKERGEVSASLDPYVQEGKTKLAKAEGQRKAEGEFAEKSSNAYNQLIELNKERDRVEKVPEFEAMYDSIMPQMVALTGRTDDPVASEGIMKIFDEGGAASGTANFSGQKLLENYNKSRIVPKGTMIPVTATVDGKQKTVNMNEESVKRMEKNMLRTLVTGKDAQGQPINDQDRSELLSQLYSSPLLGGKPSPYYIAGLGFATDPKKSKAVNPKFSKYIEQMKKLSQ